MYTYTFSFKQENDARYYERITARTEEEARKKLEGRYCHGTRKITNVALIGFNPIIGSNVGPENTDVLTKIVEAVRTDVPETSAEPVKTDDLATIDSLRNPKKANALIDIDSLCNLKMEVKSLRQQIIGAEDLSCIRELVIEKKLCLDAQIKKTEETWGNAANKVCLNEMKEFKTAISKKEYYTNLLDRLDRILSWKNFYD